MQKSMWIPKIIIILLCLWAYNPNNPYSYYIVLRWVCSAAFIVLALYYFGTGQLAIGFLCSVGVIVYNPILMITGLRSLWGVVNFITILFAAATLFIPHKQ